MPSLTGVKKLTALLLLALLSACQSGMNERVATLFARVDSLRGAHRFDEALALVDSALQISASDTAALRQAVRQRRIIRLRQSEVRLVELDKELARNKSALDSAEKFFEKHPDKVEGVRVRYTHPLLSAKHAGARPHLRVQLTDEGLIPISVYCGRTYVRHNAMRISVGSEGVTTPIVPHDEALSYRYHDGLRSWELVTYTTDVGEEIATKLMPELVANNRTKVELLDGVNAVASFTLSQEEAKALYESLRLASLMHEKKQLEREQQTHRQRLDRLGNFAE